MVRPDDETYDTDGDHCIGHSEITEHRLAAEGCDDLADNAKARQDHDIYFGMPEEPEQMLIKHRVAACGCIEECTTKVTVDQQHGYSGCQYRQSQQ